jgi:hypothetical protein
VPRVAIFLCDDETIVDCFRHNLFGTREGYGLQVQRGDFLLLYNFSQNNISGIWRAASDGGNFIPNSWRGRFPNQVRIEQTDGEIICKPRNQVQALVGFQIIGHIYEGTRAENLLQGFRRNVQEEITSPTEQLPRNRNPQQIEPDYLLLPPKIFCEDTDRVRSQGEKIIDDCLFQLGVRHDYEPTITIRGGQLIPDFAVYSKSGKPIYIEYWGKLNEQNYDKRRREKTRLYKENNLPLIQIVPDDLRVIKFVLEKELEKWNVPFKKSKRGFFDSIIYFLRRIFR